MRSRACPKGTIKAVIDAYGELVDEGCLAVFGPAITDNCVPTREAIEERFHVPAISVTGTDDWLGEWTFSLSMGSMTDEPIFWADLLAKAVTPRSACSSSSRSSARPTSGTFGRRAAPKASASWPRSGSPRPRRTSVEPVRRIYEAKAAAARALRLRLRDRPRQPRPAADRLGSASIHGYRVPERVDPPGHVGRDPRLDRVSTSTTRGTSSASGSSTSTRPHTGGAPSTAYRSSTAISRRSCSMPSPTPIR